MIDENSVPDLIGRTAVDVDGDKIGKVGQVYLDDETGAPKWVTVSTGMFGNKESFAPLEGASQDGDNLRLAVQRDLVKGAPQVEADGHLDDSENGELFTHYAGHLGSAGGQGHDVPSQGHDTSGPNTDDAMTRSEERLQVGTQQVEAGRARLRKYVVTENVTTTVPVSHEEVRVDREPITEANRDAATSGADISEEEHEITLHAEQPVVAKETVPVERVRLSSDTVTEEQTVNEEVRKEQIDAPDSDR
jgi:uncharacterized protein (TIGR02271 family)